MLSASSCNHGPVLHVSVTGDWQARTLAHDPDSFLPYPAWCATGAQRFSALAAFHETSASSPGVKICCAVRLLMERSDVRSGGLAKVSLVTQCQRYAHDYCQYTS